MTKDNDLALAIPEVAPVPASASPSAPSMRLPLILALLVTALGLSAFAGPLIMLWDQWMNDGLRSIGILVPPTCVWLCFRAWRHQPGLWRGSWWGAVVILILFVAVSFRSGMFPGVPLIGPLFRVSLNAKTDINFLPAGMQLFLYLSGAVVLFGGRGALRRALFPLSLILLVDPMPHWLQQQLDLPLQQIGAQAARGFAGWLSVPLNGDLLHLMFTPTHGVFIAPGCDGLRGSITLGFATLVVGHLYRLRPWIHAGYVLSAVLAAYLLNFVRLCIVVSYTALATHVSPTWFGHGVTFDYLAGGLLFLATTVVFLNWPRRHPGLCTPA